MVAVVVVVVVVVVAVVAVMLPALALTGLSAVVATVATLSRRWHFWQDLHSEHCHGYSEARLDIFADMSMQDGWALRLHIEQRINRSGLCCWFRFCGP